MAIESVLEQRKEYPMGSLTAQDLFYVKVSKVQDLFRVLGDMAENQVKADHATSSNNLILEVNAVILVSTRRFELFYCCQRIGFYRSQLKNLYKFRFAHMAEVKPLALCE